jgi:hypothetical protein
MKERGYDDPSEHDGHHHEVRRCAKEERRLELPCR